MTEATTKTIHIVDSTDPFSLEFPTWRLEGIIFDGLDESEIEQALHQLANWFENWVIGHYPYIFVDISAFDSKKFLDNIKPDHLNVLEAMNDLRLEHQLSNVDIGKILACYFDKRDEEIHNHIMQGADDLPF